MERIVTKATEPGQTEYWTLDFCSTTLQFFINSFGEGVEPITTRAAAFKEVQDMFEYEFRASAWMRQEEGIFYHHVYYSEDYGPELQSTPEWKFFWVGARKREQDFQLQLRFQAEREEQALRRKERSYLTRSRISRVSLGELAGL